MGFLDIENKGPGYIGPIGDNWSITYNTSPSILGTGVGRLGSITFSTRCDETTKFTIDNYLSVKHFFDNQTTRWLSAFDVNIRSVTTTDDFASFTTVSRVSQLDVVRRSRANPAGVYQRKMIPPSGKSYTVSGTGYTTPVGATVYDVAMEPNYVYVLAAGSHGGEVVHVFGVDGIWNKVYPVYSDASDVANPQSRYLAYSSGYLWVAQVALDRVKRFISFNGSFVDQFGSGGTGNGQFDTISCIAASSGSVYVGDSILSRVQRFTLSGTYVSKFGGPGSGMGYFEFAQVNSVNVNPSDTLVYVGDNRARIREYTTTGVYVSNGFGNWNYAANKPYAPFAANSRIDICFDGGGNAFAAQDGHVYKFTHDQTAYLNGTWEDGPRLVDEFSGDFGTQIASASWDGILHIVSSDGLSIMQYSGSTRSLTSLILYYIALAASDFPCQINVYDPWVSEGVPVTIPEWDMSVWEALGELCAATGNAAMATDEYLQFYNRKNRGAWVLPSNLSLEPVEVNSQNSGRRIEIVNQNAKRTAGPPQIMYSAILDNNRTFNANIGSIDTITVSQNTYPEYLVQPLPQGATANPFSNPSIEVDLTDTGYYVPPGGVGAFSRGSVADFTYFGSGYARLLFTTAPPTAYSFISNRVDVYPGVPYDFRVFARCSGAAQKAHVFIDWRDVNGQNVDFIAGPSTTITANGWQELSMGSPVTAPIGASYAYVEVRHSYDGRPWLNGEALYADAWSDGWFFANTIDNPDPAPGRYTVYDNNSVLVDPTAWTNYGGKVQVAPGERAGDISLTIHGPGYQIPGTEAPYSIRTITGGGALEILGGGIVTDPVTIQIGTGVPESVSNREVAQSVNTPFAWSAQVAYSEGGWLAYRAALRQGFTVTMKISETPTWMAFDSSGEQGTYSLIGRVVRHRDAFYIIEEVQANAFQITLTLVLHSTYGGVGFDIDPHVNEVWSGKLAGEFDTFWSSRSAQEFTIAPMENPYGV